MEDKKMKNAMKYFVLAAVVLFGAVSCQEFLDRPSEDSYTTGDFYKNDAQVEQGINYLYNSPWYDIIRFYIYGSETMCGNVYQGQNELYWLYANLFGNRARNINFIIK